MDESDYDYRCYLVWAVMGRLALISIFIAMTVKGILDFVYYKEMFILAWSMWAAILFFGFICLCFKIIDKYSLEPWLKEHGWKISVVISALCICAFVAFALWECWVHISKNPNSDTYQGVVIIVIASLIIIGAMLDMWCGWINKLVTKFCKKIKED